MADPAHRRAGLRSERIIPLGSVEFEPMGWAEDFRRARVCGCCYTTLLSGVAQGLARRFL